MGRLHEHRNMSPIAMFLHVKIKESDKKQKEIAKEVGYDNPNVLSMMKHGEAKVPFDKVPALAKALDADSGYLMLLSIEQHWPGMLDVIKRIFGNIVSESEMLIVKAIRAAYHGTDPGFSQEHIDAAIVLLKRFKRPPQDE